MDTTNVFQLLKTYFNARLIAEPTMKRTKNGVHFDLPIDCDIGIAMEIRNLLCDDPIRMNFDEMKISCRAFDTVDTLFEMKRAKDGKWYSEEDFNILSEPFFQKGKARKT